MWLVCGLGSHPFSCTVLVMLAAACIEPPSAQFSDVSRSLTQAGEGAEASASSVFKRRGVMEGLKVKGCP